MSEDGYAQNEIGWRRPKHADDPVNAAWFEPGVKPRPLSQAERNAAGNPDGHQNMNWDCHVCGFKADTFEKYIVHFCARVK